MDNVFTKLSYVQGCEMLEIISLINEVVNN